MGCAGKGPATRSLGESKNERLLWGFPVSMLLTQSFRWGAQFVAFPRPQQAAPESRVPGQTCFSVPQHHPRLEETRVMSNV